MDNQYHQNYLPYSSANQHQHYASLGAISNPHHHHQQQQQQQESSSDAPTLPPLQSQNGSFSHLPSLYTNQSNPNTPTGPHTPTTSSMSSSTPHPYSQYPSPVVTTGSMPPPNSYGPLGGSFTSSQSMMQPSSTATSAAAVLAGVASRDRLPDIRPMPQGSYNGLSSLPSFQASTLIPQQLQYLQQQQTQEAEPTHVVGSQGRRGILPSAPGRAAPPTPGTAASTKSMIPAKDADGKFPCPHCNKTYLHAKHLKRHLLRHTGDRPYMCHLCKDTFSRSDILKRHFQKCSIRRGNPTGANHLAHQRRNTNNSNRLSVGNGEQMGLASLPEVAGPAYTNGNMMNGPTSSSPTVGPDQPSYASSVASISNRSSRANSLLQQPTSMAESRYNMSGTGVPTLGSNVSNGDHASAAPSGFGSSGYMRPHSMSNPIAPNYGFANPVSGSDFYTGVKAENNPMTYPRQSSHLHNSTTHENSNGIDWSHMFNPGGQDGFMTQSNQAPSQMPVKTENGVENHGFNGSNENQNENFFSGLYSHPTTYGDDSGAHHLSGFANWNMDLVQSDPLQSKADALLTYVFSNRTPSSDTASDEMRRCLTVDNMKHFVEQFTSFQGHWPTIHMPTFSLMEANSALVLTIICVGAIYSNKRDVYQTRAIMELVKDAVKSQSRAFCVYTGTMSEGDHPLGTLTSDIEEMQALTILQTIFSWHGNPSQRAAARSEFGTVVGIARKMGLTLPVAQGHQAYSLLHQPETISQSEVSTWSWTSWVEQEKRSRALYSLFLMDAALVMYFNNPPQFDPFEIRLPLPTDDVAWDAKNPTDCADALGLHGYPAQVKNLTGSQRPRQPDMRSAMRSLMDPNYAFQRRATNAYSKFILIHALHIQIWKVQRANFQHGTAGLSGFGGLSSSGPGTPLSQNDWLSSTGASNSGRSTPTEGLPAQSSQAHQLLKGIHMALSKWRQCWEADLAVQYPHDSTLQRRFGFSRDAIHFYYLGQSFLRSTNANDWTAPADVRFTQVMTLLKKIKGFVVNDNVRQGHDIGSVGDIDDTYGVGDLTLDMKLLFKPYNSNTDSPVMGVLTNLA